VCRNREISGFIVVSSVCPISASTPSQLHFLGGVGGCGEKGGTLCKISCAAKDER
jgi:hypothetical protein